MDGYRHQSRAHVDLDNAMQIEKVLPAAETIITGPLTPWA